MKRNVRIMNLLPLFVTLLFFIFSVISCANDQSFEGTWKKTEKLLGVADISLVFKADKSGKVAIKIPQIPQIPGVTGTQGIQGASGLPLVDFTWKVDFKNKKITVAGTSNGQSMEIKATYKFSSNFTKLELSEITPSEAESFIVGSYEKQ